MSTPDQLTGKVLYSILRYEDNRLWLFVNPKDYWEEENCQADWTPQEVFDAMQDLGVQCGEAMEGVVEIYEGRMRPASEEVEMALTLYLQGSDLFEYDESFDTFMKEHFGDI